MTSGDALATCNLSKSFAGAAVEVYPILKLLKSGALFQEWSELLSWKDFHMKRVFKAPWYQDNPVSEFTSAMLKFNEEWHHRQIDGFWYEPEEVARVIPWYLPLPPNITSWISWLSQIADQEEEQAENQRRIGSCAVVRAIEVVLGRLFLKPITNADLGQGKAQGKGSPGEKKKKNKKVEPGHPQTSVNLESYPGIMICHTARGGALVERSKLYRTTIPNTSPPTTGSAIELAFDALVNADTSAKYIGPFSVQQSEFMAPCPLFREWWTAFYIRISSVVDDVDGDDAGDRDSAVAPPRQEVAVLVFNTHVSRRL